MLNEQAIYRKTPRGTEAIANRQSGLAPKLRSLLIMVDGKRTVADLSALSAVVGDREQGLMQLAQEGLIEQEGDAWPENASTWMEATVPAPLSSATSLAEAKRVASRLLMEMLGPTANALSMKVEAAGDMAEFDSVIQRARDVLRDVKGSTAADRFVAQVELHTPPS